MKLVLMLLTLSLISFTAANKPGNKDACDGCHKLLSKCQKFGQLTCSLTQKQGCNHQMPDQCFAMCRCKVAKENEFCHEKCKYDCIIYCAIEDPGDNAVVRTDVRRMERVGVVSSK
jgi:hypothetical protein